MRLALIVAAFVAGVALALATGSGWPVAASLVAPIGGLAAIGGVGVFAWRFGRPFFPVIAAIALLALAIGVGRVAIVSDAGASPLLPFHLENGAGTVLVEGTVVGEPERAGRAYRLTLEVESIDVGDGPARISGRLLATLSAPETPVTARRGLPYRQGDRLALLGRLAEPPGVAELGFDYPAYLARQGISTVMSFPRVSIIAEGVSGGPVGWLASLRRSMATAIRQVEPEPQASVGTAMLLGVRDELPASLVESFRRSGASHLLAISGLHVGIVLGLVLLASRAVLGRKRHLYLVAPLLAVWLYAALAGMSPTVARAAIMGTVYLLALLVGRPGTALPALAAAVGVMVAIDPATVGDVSFQLSVAAVAGIALLARPLTGWSVVKLGLANNKDGAAVALARGAVGLAAVTVVATGATLPIIALNFGAVSLIGVPVALLTLPAVPFVLVGQALAALGGSLGGGFGEALGWVAWLPTAYLTSVVSAAANVPGVSLTTGVFTGPLVFAYYGVGLAAVFAWRGSLRKHGMSESGRPFQLRGARVLAATALLIGCAALWGAASGQGDGRLHVVFLDVGQGDAIYIETPAGSRVLVDGGPDPLDAVRALGERGMAGDRSIDLLVLTHPHSDHLGGLIGVLDRYDVRAVMERRLELDGSLYETWRTAIADEGARSIVAMAGTRLTIDGLLIEVLSPFSGPQSDINDASVVLKLTYGGVSFLLAGDVFATGERAMVRAGADLSADVLKVAHHGSRTSASGVFLAAVDPAVAVISLGADNRFGHPHSRTLNALAAHVEPESLYRTDLDGTVEMSTDGERLWVQIER
jgi:competence protein ComEC